MADKKNILSFFSSKKQLDNHSNVNSFGKLDTHNRAKALEESRAILEQIDRYEIEEYDAAISHQQETYSFKGNYLISSCCYCKVLITKRKKSECRTCSRLFCCKHLKDSSHNCNIGKSKLIQGKNLFKIRLRQVKNTLAVKE
jgi:hypothetical protein